MMWFIVFIMIDIGWHVLIPEQSFPTQHLCENVASFVMEKAPHSFKDFYCVQRPSQETPR